MFPERSRSDRWTTAKGRARVLAMAGLVGALGLCAPALAQPVFNEMEPNDGKYDANGPFAMAPGNSIQGFTTGSSTLTAGNGSADNFLVKTLPAAPGIYQHRLVITTTGTAGHTGTIRGLTQTSGVINLGTDAALQTSSTLTSPPRYNQWYGFGKEESIYYRVAGTASTTSDYVSTLETTPITPIDIGTYYNGLITIDRPTGITTDTDFWVYDSKFDAIPDYGNDDPNTLTRFFAPGVYYIGYTNFNFANDQPAATGESFLSGIVTDFRNVAANSSTTLFPSLGIRLTDAFNAVSIPTPKNSQYDVVWLRFTVSSMPPATGACCLPDGSCVQATASGCAGLGGVFSGDGVDCSAVVCAQPGACCFITFSCSVLSAGQCAAAGGNYLGDGTLCGTCPPPPPGVNPEVEPNDSKALANGPIVMAPGDTIVGVTTGSSISVPGDTSADYFLVRTTPAGPGIYRHRLVISTSGTAGHIGTIRGLTQTSGVINPGTDAIVQTSSTITTPPRYVQWYGFGKEEQIYFRITGTASTTSFYTVTLETELVSAQGIGSYFNGDITLARAAGITTDTDFWVYDSNFNAIPDYGNDDPDTLTRPYAIGTYYVAYTNFNFANDQPAATGDTSVAANVLDFPNAAANSSTLLLPSLAISVTDAFNQVTVATPKNTQYDVVWLSFTVTDTPPPTGACCLDDGSCVQATAAGCLGLGGVFSGDGVDCSAVMCPQPGACCLSTFGCSIISANQCATQGGTFLGSGTLCGACPPPPPGTFPEAEPNDSKAQATVVSGMVSGNLILGNSTGAATVPGPTSPDYFEISTAMAAPGFYRHRLTLEAGGTTAHSATIRGLNQVATTAGAWPCPSGTAGTTDTVVQTSFIPTGTLTRVSQWFGFGKGERVYYRVSGTASTTANYTATLETTPEPIVDIGNFAPGQITITTVGQGHTTDTDMWVYDSNFNAIPGYGNDDNSVDAGGPGTGFQSLLVRPFDPGTYYLAMSTFQTAVSEPAACDDRFRTGTLMDFPGSLANSSTGINANVTFSVIDANGTVQVPATRPGQFDILLFQFTVGGGTTFCSADWNEDGLVNSNDISAFITAWLDSVQNGNLIADFNGDMVVNSNDISAFITAWLAQLNGC